MSQRIDTTFSGLRTERRSALITFITAGDPEPAVTVPLMHALAEAGADIIELGVPFSDPMADGPVIQRASERALRHGTRLADVLAMVRTFREQDSRTPVVLMGYLNPIEVIGYEHFAREAAEAGVDGVLTVDLPPEEGGKLVEALRQHGVAPIHLLAPTTTEARMARILERADGFVYYVSIKGVTGGAEADLSEAADKIAAIRRHTGLPVGIGFGIRDAESARRFAAISDAVIVGSALVTQVEALADEPQKIPAAVAARVAEMAQALRQAGGGA